jgi:hypothetical protein
MIQYLAENSLPIWMGGAVAFTMALVAYLQTRGTTALLSMVAVLAIAATLLVTERMIETPAEAVERTLYELAATVEANDVAGTLRFISLNPAPNAKVLRKDIEAVMPQVRIERARLIGVPQIEIRDDGNSALVECRGIVFAVRRSDGMKGGGEDRFTMEWVRSDDRWLLRDYISQKHWERALGR